MKSIPISLRFLRSGLPDLLRSNTGVICVLLVSFALAALTHSVLRNLDNRHSEVQQWQSRNLSRQVEWLWVSTRINKHQQTLLQSVSNYVANKPGASKEKLINNFDIYWSWYNSLDAFNGSYYDLLLEDNHFDGETRELIVELGESASELQKNGSEHLARLEKIVLQINKSDSAVTQKVLQETDNVMAELIALGESVVILMRQSMQAQEHSSRELTKSLSAAFMAIAAIVSLSVLGMGLYFLQKLDSNKRLRGLNRKLTDLYTEKSQQAKLMETLALEDSLTGLLNREGYYRKLRAAFDETGPHGVVFLDLDMFNVVNDSAGRKGGDELIQQIGVEFAGLCERHCCCAARLGDDEFAFLCQNVTENQFEEIVDAIQNLFSPMLFAHLEREFRQTASIGAYFFDVDNHTDDSVMARADAACLEAKRAGGNRVRYYTDHNSLVAERQSDMQVIEQIHAALDHNRFVLYYQPIVTLTEGGHKPYSYELLIRMTASNGELVPPGIFLGVAERYGLMPRIDQWVVNEALSWLENNDIQKKALQCININLSGLSINDDDWIANLLKEISGRKVNPAQICFEITESAALYNSALGNLNSLRDVGVRLSLDDFGSGFSSFEYLEQLPVDQVKIDGAFIRDLDSNHTHQEFIRAIAAMCNALNKFTVGEFVENEASMNKLRELGVHGAQGYHLAVPAPLPVKAAESALQQVA